MLALATLRPSALTLATYLASGILRAYACPVHILVTGATGFIGSRLCRALLDASHDIRALVRPQGHLEVLAGLPLELVSGDILEPSSLEACVEGVEVVIHCAGELGPRASHLRPDVVLASHVVGTRNVAQAALRAGVDRFVYTSSVAALGVPEIPSSAETTPLMTETHAWNYDARLWPYGYAKHMAELEALDVARDGLDTVIVNPSIVIGGGDLHQVSNGFIVFVARHGLPVAVQGGVNVVHIDDVVQGLSAALERGRTGERYILAGENLSIPHLLTLTARIAHRKPPRWTLSDRAVASLSSTIAVLPRLLGLPIPSELLRLAGRYFFYDTSKAREAFGLGMPRPYHKAAAESLAWYAENGFLGR
jgi:dihydroflavonol-4-reductase